MGGLEEDVHQEVADIDKIKENLVEEVEDGENAVDGLESGEGLLDDAKISMLQRIWLTMVLTQGVLMVQRWPLSQLCPGLTRHPALCSTRLHPGSCKQVKVDWRATSWDHPQGQMWALCLR